MDTDLMKGTLPLRRVLAQTRTDSTGYVNQKGHLHRTEAFEARTRFQEVHLLDALDRREVPGSYVFCLPFSFPDFLVEADRLVVG